MAAEPPNDGELELERSRPAKRCAKRPDANVGGDVKIVRAGTLDRRTERRKLENLFSVKWIGLT